MEVVNSSMRSLVTRFREIIWAPRFHQALACLLASPRGLLRLHRMRLAVGVAELFLWTWQLGLLSSFRVPELDPTTAGVLVLLVMALLPTCTTAVRLPLLMRTERRCTRLVRSFYAGGDVGNLLLDQLRGMAVRDMLAFSLVFVIWYSFGFYWASVTPPCGYLSTWQLQSSTMFRCNAFRCLCACFFVSNTVFFYCAMTVPQVEQQFRQRFAPHAQKGLPAELIAQLTTYEFRSDHAPQMRAECTICLEDFHDGEQMRRLPCGHDFHARCIDEWLGRTPACPLRCPHDLWAVLRDEAA